MAGRRTKRDAAAEASLAAIAQGDRFDFTKQVGFLLRKAAQRNQTIYQQYCIDPQMTSVQFAALYAIYDNGPCSLSDLGRAAAIDPATTRGVVERLRDRDLISVTPDAEDRRKVIVRLEPEGRRLVERMVPFSIKVSEATMKRLNVAERIALMYLLTKISTPDDEPPTEP